MLLSLFQRACPPRNILQSNIFIRDVTNGLGTPPIEKKFELVPRRGDIVTITLQNNQQPDFYRVVAVIHHPVVPNEKPKRHARTELMVKHLANLPSLGPWLNNIDQRNHYL